MGKHADRKIGRCALSLPQQANADKEIDQSAASWKSAVILAEEDQLEALARLRFEPQGTDELVGLVMAHAPARPWLVAAWTEVRRTWHAEVREGQTLLVGAYIKWYNKAI